jgi:NAD-dependent deacetylase
MEELDTVVAALDKAQLVVAATGAGMSKESGIPTFRDAQEGLWACYNPEELATRQGFSRNPARVWGWYNYRRGLIAQGTPHAGHLALATLEDLVPQVVVVTQTIDGLHRQAGSNSILELHGNINRFKCFDQDHPVEVDVPLSDTDGELEPPNCPHCGSPIRPDVVWFGEMLPPGVFEKAQTLSDGCDLMLVVGTSGMVQPAANLPLVASASGATVVEVNVEPSQLSHYVDIFLQGPAGAILPELVARLEARRS